MRAVILYAIGAGSLAFGFYEFWRDGVADQNAFGIGAVCLAAGAGLQVLQDLWRKITRR
ncbi:MAG TPA: hypothetical protein VFA59_19025 [Vicinamibacterales bacterium]|nr:hypothetical protein [Vicinamibacterales bacterium]